MDYDDRAIKNQLYSQIFKEWDVDDISEECHI